LTRRVVPVAEGALRGAPLPLTLHKRSQNSIKRRMKLPIRNLITKHPFFKELSEKHVEFFEEAAYTAHYPAGTYLFHEGNQSDRFFYIVKGKVALEFNIPGRQMVSYETVPKEHIVGWSWLMPPHSWVFDGRAVREVEVVCFDGEKIRAEAEKDHELGFYLYRYFAGIMTRRILSSRMQLMDIYAKQKGSEYL